MGSRGGIHEERWRALSPLLDELFELDEGARAQRLSEVAARDPTIGAELIDLLARQLALERDAFLEGTAFDAAPLQPVAGEVMGAYTLERVLGRGGMGTVWLARRSDGRFEGKAAVKLVDASLLTRGGAERFRREGSILGRLDHANIARLLDAGVAGARPFLVLEYVEGEPIDAWCAAHRLGVEARIRLFLGVLDAVAHAHDKLVLHRDLKPSNILVTREGQPKLLDFGIAKLLEEDARPAPVTELTRQGGRAFTPGYAAPEQVEGLDATTATDVYALGVVLYWLLAGAHPTSAPGATPLAQLRAVVEVEPARASEAALRAGPEAARARGTTVPSQLARRLRGDLDVILARALKKPPGERYPTAHALADDLRRHLVDEPITARRDAFGYRLGKAMRRHRLAFGAAAAVALALVAGVIGTTSQAVEARRQRGEAIQQRDLAQRLFARNQAVADFVETMFADEAPGGQAALQEMLDRSSRRFAASTREQPDFQAEVLRVLAAYYMALDDPRKAAPLLERASDLAGARGDPSLRALISCSRAKVLLETGDKDGAVRLLAPWLDAAELDGNVAAYCLAAAAMVAESDVAAPAILDHARRGLRRLRSSPFPSRRIEATLLGDEGIALHLLGRAQESDASYAAALGAFESLGRQESEDALRLMVDWANVAGDAGDVQRALGLHERVLRIERARRGVDATPLAIGSYAFDLERLGRLAEALKAYADTLAASERTGSAPGTVYAWIGRASVLERMGEADRAEAALRRALALAGNALPEAHPARLRWAGVRARLDAARGRLDEARVQLTRVIELLAARGISHPASVNAYCSRAEVALAQGDRAGALADAAKALDLARTLQGDRPFSVHTGHALVVLGKALRQDGQAARAAESFAQARDNFAAASGTDSPDAIEAARLIDPR